MQLVLLHALPLDASMWAPQADLLPGATIAPTLYGLGDSIEEWARAVLDLTDGGPLVVVGSSVGGSCALEMAALAPDRVRALVLVGAKAAHRPDPALRDAAVELLRRDGMDAAWRSCWEPLFSRSAAPAVVASARAIAARQSVEDVVRGVRAFHGRRNMDGFAARWPHPLVVVAGADDTAPSPTTASALAASARRGEFHLVPDCGHYVGLERPTVLEGIVRRALRDG